MKAKYPDPSERLYSHNETCPGKPECLHDEADLLEETSKILKLVYSGRYVETNKALYYQLGNIIEQLTKNGF